MPLKVLGESSFKGRVSPTSPSYRPVLAMYTKLQEALNLYTFYPTAYVSGVLLLVFGAMTQAATSCANNPDFVVKCDVRSANGACLPSPDVIGSYKEVLDRNEIFRTGFYNPTTDQALARVIYTIETLGENYFTAHNFLEHRFQYGIMGTPEN